MFNGSKFTTLQYLDISGNMLEHFDANMLPPTMKRLYMRRNQLKDVDLEILTQWFQESTDKCLEIQENRIKCHRMTKILSTLHDNGFNITCYQGESVPVGCIGRQGQIKILYYGSTVILAALVIYWTAWLFINYRGFQEEGLSEDLIKNLNQLDFSEFENENIYSGL
jgi:Leucine-rich repeat (LRR) protein